MLFFNRELKMNFTKALISYHGMQHPQGRFCISEGLCNYCKKVFLLFEIILYI